jgi:hypothetical protein
MKTFLLLSSEHKSSVANKTHQSQSRHTCTSHGKAPHSTVLQQIAISPRFLAMLPQTNEREGSRVTRLTATARNGIWINGRLLSCLQVLYTTNCMGQSHSVKLIVVQLVKNSISFLEPEVSSPCSQDSASGPYPEPVKSTSHLTPHPF